MAPWVRAGIVLLALAMPQASSAAEEDTAEPAKVADAPSLDARCAQHCLPRNLIFLPCMAVGAKNMAACREREVARCHEACLRRPR